MLIFRLLPSTVRLTPKMVRHLTSANTTSTQIASEENDVLFTSYGSRGLITLNRPKQLNAINLSMVQKLFPKIIEWENNKELIVIKGNSPKAFCAGGDVVSIAKDKTGKEGRDYFRCEYLNNALIASLQVPYVALIHGIVMGGGVGVSIHGKYRVATETSLFAMPETQIGLFPDVGVSHFLARMPYSLGSFLALTGYRIKGYDLVHTGIATHFCHSECLSDLEGELMKSDTDVEQVLQAFHEKSIKMVQKLPERIPPITTSKEPAFTLSDNLDNIEYAFSASTVEEILVRLDERRNPFIAELIDLLGKMSPLSLKVSHHQIRVTDELDVYETLNQDYRLAWRLLNEHDYYEGVRALLIDKDKNPQWDPSCLADVSDELVQDMFLPLDEEDELNLPESLKMEKSKL